MEQSQQNRTGLVVAILVILGLTAGAVVGLLLGWVVWPVQYTDTAIADLAPEYKDEYIILVAAAYTTDGDLEKAQVRLARLELPNVNQSLSALIDRYILEGQDEAEIRALVALANAQGVMSPNMVAYLATSTPVPTDTPLPTPTPLPTDTPTPVPPTDTAVPTAIPPTDTPAPEPTDTAAPTAVPPTSTAIPPTNTPVPQATNTPKPPPTNTPKPQPTNPPAAKWSWSASLLGPVLGPNQNQQCEAGNQQIIVTVAGADGGQIGGVWLREYYSGQYQVTGHKAADPYYGPGEAEFSCAGTEGGGQICIASGSGEDCVSDYSRGMSCYYAPSFEDLWAAGYCECCDVGISKEQCLEYYNSKAQCMDQPRHYSWRLLFKRSW